MKGLLRMNLNGLNKTPVVEAIRGLLVAMKGWHCQDFVFSDVVSQPF